MLVKHIKIDWTVSESMNRDKCDCNECLLFKAYYIVRDYFQSHCFRLTSSLFSPIPAPWVHVQGTLLPGMPQWLTQVLCTFGQATVSLNAPATLASPSQRLPLSCGCLSEPRPQPRFQDFTKKLSCAHAHSTTTIVCRQSTTLVLNSREQGTLVILYDCCDAFYQSPTLPILRPPPSKHARAQRIERQSFTNSAYPSKRS